MALNKTGIEYLTHTWNPYTGCLNWRTGVCGGGKDFKCWAMTTTERFPKNYPNGFEPTFYPERLLDPLKRKKSARIGVAFMGDLFGDWVDIWMPVSVIFPNGQKIINCSFHLVMKDIMQRCPQHTFVFLTKCPWNLPKWNPWPGNAWVGFTATSTKMFANSIIKSQGIKATVRFVSFEPLLEWSWNTTYKEPLEIVLKAEGINWIIIGAATNPTRLPKIEWVQEIVEAANQAGVPVFLKDNLLELVNYRAKETEFAFDKEGYYRQEYPSVL